MRAATLLPLFLALAALLVPGLLALGSGGPGRQDPAPKPGTPEAAEQTCFATADYDENGWISLREAEESLGIDRAEFQLFDRDGDGRVDRSEFGQRYRETIERGGGFRQPVPKKAAAALPPRRSAEQLQQAYDQNGDGFLDALEVSKILVDYRIHAAGVSSWLVQLDRDRSGRLELPELEGLATALSTILTPGLQPTPIPEKKTLEQLFGVPKPRLRALGVGPEPPRIAGPVPYFLRLDLDRDGYVDEGDMTELGKLLQVGVRGSTVLHSLDRDGDRRLSRAEFDAAFE